MSAVAEPPAISSTPTIVDTPPPAPPPPPKGEIHVTDTPTDNGPPQVIKKGSAMERMTQELRKRAKPQFFEPKEETPTAPATQPEGQPPTVPDPKAPEGVEATPSSTPSPEPEKKEKKNPWKMYEAEKARAQKAEAELESHKKTPIIPAEKEAYEKRVADLQAKNEALEKEIRFTNYAKSEEFQTKYQKPYEKAWQRAAKEITSVEITDPQTGKPRPATVQDIAMLVNADLLPARKAAEDMFGPLASDVMSMRNEIRGIFDQQQQALEDAKNNSIKRDEQTIQSITQANSDLAKAIKDTWEAANNELASDEKMGSLFKPIEGDQDGNQRLAKGFELVDRAFSENPSDPKLSADERKAVVKRHAAVRMRAAGFGRVYAQSLQKDIKIAALEKELAQYKRSTPGVNGRVEPSKVTPSSGWDRIRSDLAKIAKPA